MDQAPRIAWPQKFCSLLITYMTSKPSNIVVTIKVGVKQLAMVVHVHAVVL